jgi:hypothetical protein
VGIDDDRSCRLELGGNGCKWFGGTGQLRAKVTGISSDGTDTKRQIWKILLLCDCGLVEMGAIQLRIAGRKKERVRGY